MKNVQAILKFQIGASTVIMTGCVIVPVFILPEHFTFEGGAEKIPITVNRWTAYGCVMFGLWSGMIIGFITEYYTNNAYAPTLWLADACDKGAAPNIILGLALGYISVVVPITCITATIGFAFATAGMYGIGLSLLVCLDPFQLLFQLMVSDQSLIMPVVLPRCLDSQQKSEILLTPLMPQETPQLLLVKVSPLDLLALSVLLFSVLSSQELVIPPLIFLCQSNSLDSW
jgi:hypothetical protein